MADCVEEILELLSNPEFVEVNRWMSVNGLQMTNLLTAEPIPVVEHFMAYGIDDRDEVRRKRRARSRPADAGRAKRLIALPSANTAAAPSAAYTCELCGRPSSSRTAFEKHVAAAHPEARAALCGVCDAYAFDVPSLVDHVRREHGPEIWSEVVECCDGGTRRRTIRCDVCGKRYGNYSLMHSHRRVHCVDDSDQRRRQNVPLTPPESAPSISSESTPTEPAPSTSSESTPTEPAPSTSSESTPTEPAPPTPALSASPPPPALSASPPPPQ